MSRKCEKRGGGNRCARENKRSAIGACSRRIGAVRCFRFFIFLFFLLLSSFLFFLLPKLNKRETGRCDSGGIGVIRSQPRGLRSGAMQVIWRVVGKNELTFTSPFFWQLRFFFFSFVLTFPKEHATQGREGDRRRTIPRCWWAGGHDAGKVCGAGRWVKKK